jgi:hypothetical protein
MIKKEMAEILAIMQANYPDDFRGMSDTAMNAKINLWFMQFRDDEYKDVLAAVMAHIATDTNRFMPPVGVIKAKLVEIRQPDEMTEMEAWDLVSKATRNSTYNSAEEFAKLPPVVQRLVGSPMQLREWAAMDTETLQSVVASNFQRSYKVRAKSEREYLALPSSVKTYMASLAGGMKMPALPDGEITEEKRMDAIRRLSDL